MRKTSPKWKHHDGYVLVFMPSHPMANANGAILAHRMIAYDAGLLKNKRMEVHHKNGDKADNRLRNLQIISKSEHARITWKGKKRGHWSRARRLKWSEFMMGNTNYKGTTKK